MVSGIPDSCPIPLTLPYTNCYLAWHSQSSLLRSTHLLLCVRNLNGTTLNSVKYLLNVTLPGQQQDNRVGHLPRLLQPLPFLFLICLPSHQRQAFWQAGENTDIS